MIIATGLAAQLLTVLGLDQALKLVVNLTAHAHSLRERGCPEIMIMINYLHDIAFTHAS